jgi:hypothetical protein
MSSPAQGAPDSRGAARFVPLFVAIVVVEILTIAALYWFGRHFGPA